MDNLKEQRGNFTEREARQILFQIVQGFKAIYEMQVMHRDLKLANILVNFPDMKLAVPGLDSNKMFEFNKCLQQLNLKQTRIEIKIADLGFAKEVKEGDMTETMCGTPLVMAPEVLNGKLYDHKADVWSLGIVFFELLTGFTPFTGIDKNDLKKNLEKGIYKLPKQLQLSLAGLDFLNGCL